MPKPYTFPTLLDKVNTLKISFFREHGYLKPNQYRGGVIRWNENGFETSSIAATVSTFTEPAYIEFNYTVNAASKKYTVELFKAPSNLGRGDVWYFICPRSGKRCRKLYFVNGIFCHREAFTGCLYGNQTLSKRLRDIDKSLRAVFRAETICGELKKKHLKKHYGGKPTKIYLKLTQNMQAAFRLAG